MRTIFKYLLPIIAVILFIFAYFRYTESGHKNAYTIMSLYAGYKAGLDVDIKEINTNQFPYITINTIIEDQYKVDFDGFVKKDGIDLRYTLHSTCFKSDICTFDDRIDIKGTLHIAKRYLDVTGVGKMFDGDVSYSFIKDKKIFKNVLLEIDDVNSTKLLRLLEQKAIFKGQAYARLHFDTISKKHKFGTVHYEVKDPHFYEQNIQYTADINVSDNKHTFVMNLSSKDMNLSVYDGKYDRDKKYGTADYSLDIPDISKVKKLLKGSFKGAFHAKGEMVYDKKIHIKGISKDLGGELGFDYDSKTLELYLNHVSFSKIMYALATKPVLEANVTGHGTYVLKTKEMHLKTKLQDTKLIPSKTITHLEKQFSLPLIKQVYDKSSLELSLNDGILSSHFTLANDTMHLILTNTKVNALRTAINTHIDLKIPKHTVKGQLYARIDSMGDRTLDEFYIKYNGTIEKHYKVKLDGILSKSFINMDYILSAARLPSHVCTIVDDINLSGHLSGSYNRLNITGAGNAMEGNVSYTGIKIKETFENVDLDFQNIHALKLFTLLGQPTLPNGKAILKAHFDVLSHTRKNGSLQYRLKKGKYKTLPLEFNSTIDVNTKKINFNIDAKWAKTDIFINKGIHDLDSNISKAFYTVKTADLSTLESVIGKYLGAFSSTGQIHHDKTFEIRGLTNSFGGMIDFLYKKDMLYIDLEKVSLKNFMRLFPYSTILDAQLNGNINYDYIQEKLLVETKLNHTKFLPSKLVDTVFRKSGINMLEEKFTKSTLKASYQNKILLGNVILENKQSHFYLKDININKNNHTINTHFDLKLQGQEFSGRVYGLLENPKVKLNMKKLLRYQMDKQLDSVMGKGNRKLMEAMPMEGVAKDMATEIGGGFLDMFFN